MDRERAAIELMIDRAIDEQLDVEWVQKAMVLLCFLRTSEATKQCLHNLYFYRACPAETIFGSPVTESIDLPDRIERLVMRHTNPNNPPPYVHAIRRMDSVRLKRALIRLNPEEMRA